MKILCICIGLFFSSVLYGQKNDGSGLFFPQNDTINEVPYSHPALIHYVIPINTRGKYSTSKGGEHETFGNVLMSKRRILDKADTSDRSYSVGNRIVIESHGSGANYPERLEFTLDTINYLLNDVKVFFYDNKGNSLYYDADSFSVTSIPYEVVWNHHIVAKLEGIDLLSKLFNVGYYWYQAGPIFNDSYQDRRWFSTLRGDTSSYYLYLDIATTDPMYGVNDNADRKHCPLISTYDYQNQKLIFKFCYQNTSEDIRIFDLLGKEVYRSSIPPIISSHEVSIDRLLPGYYLAKLGSQTCKVTVFK